MTSLRHLRSSTANKRPDPAAMVDGQLAMNYDIASPGLFFKDDNGTLIKVGPVHVGTTAPNVSPAAGGTAGNSIGEQWLDTTGGVYVLKVWDGSAWRSESGTFVDVSGDTMTGALTMANQQAVRFSETTANGSNYIALQATASLASNKTITLPDTTGTVVTTGDTGTVTSTMIANDTILNADVNASAAIAGSKISPDFGSQTVATTGILSTGTGSAAAPSIAFTGNTNTGIYSPGADQLAVSTGGTGRLFVASDGKVGVGTGSPVQQLSIQRSAVAGNGVVLNLNNPYGYGSGVGLAATVLRFNRSSSDAGSTGVMADILAGNESESSSAAGYLAFGTRTGASEATTERLRIDSSGRVGIGTSSPAYRLDLGTPGNAVFFNASNGADSTLRFTFASNLTTIGNTGGSAGLALETNGSERLRIDSSGRLLVGTSTYSGGGVGFEIEGTGNFGPQIRATAKGSDAFPAYQVFRKSRGASIVQNNDFLVQISCEGFDGTGFIPAALIRAEVDGTPWRERHARPPSVLHYRRWRG